MAEYTKNYNLEKQQGNDNISIEGLNENFDKIDTALGNSSRFEKASGTGTAITLSGIILEDGASKTFIVSANNNGATTTINGKKLYKPSTNIVPSLKVGKAVTVWYSQVNDCFYIISADGGDADSLGGKKATAFIEKSINLSSGTDLNTILESGFYRLNTTHPNAPGSSYSYGQMIVSRGSDTISQIVLPYSSTIIYIRSGTTTEASPSNFTQSPWKEISMVGHTHTKSEISDFPTSLPANGGTADVIMAKDTRSANNTPEWYITNYPKRTVVEFKNSSTIGLSGATYVGLITVVPYSDSSGGYPFQYTVVSGSSMRYRYGTGGTTWSSWLSISNEGHTHGAASITAGTLQTGVTASVGTDYNVSRLRNINAGTGDIAVGSGLSSGAIYIVYE